MRGASGAFQWINLVKVLRLKKRGGGVVAQIAGVGGGLRPRKDEAGGAALQAAWLLLAYVVT
jgi:hypothetical protein